MQILIKCAVLGQTPFDRRALSCPLITPDSPFQQILRQTSRFNRGGFLNFAFFCSPGQGSVKQSKSMTQLTSGPLVDNLNELYVAILCVTALNADSILW